MTTDEVYPRRVHMSQTLIVYIQQVGFKLSYGLT